VGRVGLGLIDQSIELDQHPPDLFRIGQEGFDMSEFHGVIAIPEALAPSESRDAAFHRYARSGQGHRPAGHFYLFDDLSDDDGVDLSAPFPAFQCLTVARNCLVGEF